jgi:hypothetical protein
VPVDHLVDRGLEEVAKAHVDKDSYIGPPQSGPGRCRFMTGTGNPSPRSRLGKSRLIELLRTNVRVWLRGYWALGRRDRNPIL